MWDPCIRDSRSHIRQEENGWLWTPVLHEPKSSFRKFPTLEKTMLRAFSTRRSRHGDYERLLADESIYASELAILKRSKTLPAAPALRSSITKLPSPNDSQSHQVMKPAATKAIKTHPLSLLDARRKKKTTANPEFTRYLEYVKEGGIWDVDSNTPVIYYK
ncbi:uncharacterized protein LOC110609306 isoform X2 [Manihot esculenta]|nr:uncharacterized protein LOC110609306 isoform X2 [Manihot esculenta]